MKTSCFLLVVSCLLLTPLNAQQNNGFGAPNGGPAYGPSNNQGRPLGRGTTNGSPLGGSGPPGGGYGNPLGADGPSGGSGFGNPLGGSGPLGGGSGNPLGGGSGNPLGGSGPPGLGSGNPLSVSGPSGGLSGNPLGGSGPPGGSGNPLGGSGPPGGGYGNPLGKRGPLGGDGSLDSSGLSDPLRGVGFEHLFDGTGPQGKSENRNPFGENGPIGGGGGAMKGSSLNGEGLPGSKLGIGSPLGESGPEEDEDGSPLRASGSGTLAGPPGLGILKDSAPDADDDDGNASGTGFGSLAVGDQSSSSASSDTSSNKPNHPLPDRDLSFLKSLIQQLWGKAKLHPHHAAGPAGSATTAAGVSSATQAPRTMPPRLTVG